MGFRDYVGYVKNKEISVEEGTAYPENLRTLIAYVISETSLFNRNEFMVAVKALGELNELTGRAERSSNPPENKE